MAEREAWTGEIVGLLHINNLTQADIAGKMGVTKEYVSMLLNGKKTASGAEERMRQAISELRSEKQERNRDATA